ncbi:calcineurin B-like protein 7 isoform X1 [Nicotiana sylvestris]|uniref:Calcineurin B-like protein n=2 Tax=Nicotiana TaxID=4085 RepID=A0A1S4C8X4_TOBAC|nr:PREDICTED: calcineurin B-like protein 7 isoform X1 [Nicotiana sylvestris]XP_016497590.1 PREDICTED: calcineurin B-like protein 7 isoform X1 [Nicotiana tabacum]AKN91190.1 CBL protein [Nicotiana sylvestris]
MGCALRKQERIYEDHVVLAAQTHFSLEDVKALNELFRKLSCSICKDGFISKEEFQLGLFRDSRKQSLFSDRMFKLFDSNNDGLIDFGEFIRTLSIFHPDASQAQKIAVAFKLYDLWQRGFIGREEVKELILALLYESELILTDDIVEDIVDKTLEEADSKGDGKIDIEEWNNFAALNPSLLKNMTIPYLKDITAAFPSFVLNIEKNDEIYKDF